MTQTYQLKQSQLHTLVENFLQNFDGGVVILQGDLASGKTTLTKAFVQHLKQESCEVTSPTFSLQQVYGNNLYHYDLYNKGLEHFMALGMLEELEKDGYHFVEWGDEDLKEFLLKAAIPVATITIKKLADNKREYNLCIH